MPWLPRHLSPLTLLVLVALTTRTDAHPTVPAGHGDAMAEQVRPERTLIRNATGTEMLVKGGHPTIRAKIGGKGPFLFIVDTGASSTVIDESLARELGLATRGTIRLGDPSDPEAIAADVVELSSIEIGDARFEGVRAASWDQSALFRGVDPPRGVIGFPVFHEVLLTFDYVDHRLGITPGRLPKADGRSVLPFTTPDGIPQFSIVVAGVRMDAHLDTGAGGFLSLPARLRDRVHFDGPLVEVGRARTVNSEFAIRGGTLDGRFELGSFAYERPFIETTEFALPMANVGSKALAPFAVTFDQKGKTLRLEAKAPLQSPAAPPAPAQAASAPGAKPSPPASGLRFAVADGEDMAVYDVAPGSAGERAGITAGEEVVAINGKPTAQWEDGARREALRTSPVTLTLRKAGETRDVTLRFP